MSAVINTNLASLFAQNSLSSAQSNLANSVQRLSSGLRINSAKDDASGLSIAQTMAGHIKSLDQAALTAAQAINIAQTADTSLSTTQDILLRMQQLAVAGANGSLSGSQRGAIVTELTNLNSQINSFAAGTTYNGIKLLGGVGITTVATGGAAATYSNVTSGITTSISGLVATAASTAAGTYTLSSVGASGSVAITLSGGGSTQTVTLTAALTSATAVNFSNLGVSFNISANTYSLAVLASATSLAAQISGTVVVAGAANSTLSFQIGASPIASGDSLAIGTYNNSTLNGTVDSLNSVGVNITRTLAGLAADANTSTASWDAAFKLLQVSTFSGINDISTQRATVGSVMNQLGYIQNNLTAQSANEQSARSTIVDTNYSAETSMLTKGQILQQAATAMLAQANQMPNVILSLLK